MISGVPESERKTLLEHLIPVSLRPALITLAALLWMTTATRAEILLPPSVPGQVEVKVLSCDRYSGRADLRVARVRIRVGPGEVDLRDLQCGAFQPGTSRALFLNAIDGLGRLGPSTERTAEVVFPASRRYSECRCVLGGATSLRDTPHAGAEWWQAETWEPLKPDSHPGDFGPAHRPGLSGLRRELVLRPSTEVRAGPSIRDALDGRLAAREHVEVYAVHQGWKRIRSDDGLTGWIRSDASTADLEAPLRVGRFLNDLARTLFPEGGPRRTLSESCPVSAADALPELVFALLPEIHAVYVTNLWYALDETQRDAFHLWVHGCHEVRRIVEMSTGAELRGESWGDALTPASAQREP